MQQPFGLQEIPPEERLDEAWCALVEQQVQALTGLLSHLRTTGAAREHRADDPGQHAARVHALRAITARLLIEQRQQNLMLAQELVQCRTGGQAPRQLAPEEAHRLRTIERVHKVLHAYLLIARHGLTRLFAS